jgi:hypothetical protein
MNPSLALVGDSVLDNFYWLSDPAQDTTYYLRSLGYTVYNYAVDESTVPDVLNGIKPADIYQTSRSYPYPTDETGLVRPLPLLEHAKPDLTVVSIGGNDLRTYLPQLRCGVDHFLHQALNPIFRRAYAELMRQIQVRTPQIIIIGIYIPYLGPGSAYAGLTPYREKIIGRVRHFYETMAQTYNVPFLDLSRTFNPMVRAHYGSTEIEPSDSSTFCLAHCIHHIYTHYAGYKVYYAPECGPRIIIESAGGP